MRDNKQNHRLSREVQKRKKQGKIYTKPMNGKFEKHRCLYPKLASYLYRVSKNAPNFKNLFLRKFNLKN